MTSIALRTSWATRSSKEDAGYLKFVMETTGATEEAIRQHGRSVRASIKAQAKDSEPGTLIVPDMARAHFGAKAAQRAAAPVAEPVTPKPPATRVEPNYPVIGQRARPSDLQRGQRIDYNKVALKDEEGRFLVSQSGANWRNPSAEETTAIKAGTGQHDLFGGSGEVSPPSGVLDKLSAAGKESEKWLRDDWHHRRFGRREPDSSRSAGYSSI